MPIGSIVPAAGLLLLHAPPNVASDNEVVNPTQTCGKPPIGAGAGFTNSEKVVLHPVPRV